LLHFVSNETLGYGYGLHSSLIQALDFHCESGGTVQVVVVVMMAEERRYWW